MTAAVVGVLHDDWPGADPTAFVLYDQFHRWIGPDGSGTQSGGSGPTVPNPMMPSRCRRCTCGCPPTRRDALGDQIKQDMQAVAPGWQVDVQDNNYDNGGLDRATK